METWQHIGLILVLIGVGGLVYATVKNEIRKKKPPQDHYYAERKKDEEN